MSRSRKKNPYQSTTCIGCRSGVMKQWKTMMNRKLRKVPLEEIPEKKSCGSMWTAPNDGKCFWDKPEVYRK